MPVENRSEATLLPIITEWIEPGTLIVSYSKLSENGYLHETVNHSKESVNSNGFNTDKQGHWRHMKTSLPICGTRKLLTTPVEKRKNENNLYSLNTLRNTPTKNKNISSVFILFTFMQI